MGVEVEPKCPRIPPDHRIPVTIGPVEVGICYRRVSPSRKVEHARHVGDGLGTIGRVDLEVIQTW